MKKCQFCGAWLTDDDVFCFACGNECSDAGKEFNDEMNDTDIVNDTNEVDDTDEVNDADEMYGTGLAYDFGKQHENGKTTPELGLSTLDRIRDAIHLLNKKWLVCLGLAIVLLFCVSLAVRSLKKPSEIITDVSVLEIEVGDVKTIIVDCKDTPRNFTITFDACSNIYAEWEEWTEENESIPLTITGVAEGRETLHIYMYDDDSKKVISEKNVLVIVDNKSDISLETDIEVIDLLIGESIDLTVTIIGDYPENSFLRYTSVDSIELSWGEWISDYETMLTVTALQESSGVIVISYYDATENEEGIYICSAVVPFNVRKN